MTSPTVTIHTDGACKGNPGPGGWGAWLRTGAHSRKLCGGETLTTNNRMELLAAITALESLNKACQVALYTDSGYVKDGLNKWLPGWKKNGWKTAAKAPVKNQDLWQRLDLACTRHEISWHWVKGHAGDEGNEEADRLANLGTDRVKGGEGNGPFVIEA